MRYLFSILLLIPSLSFGQALPERQGASPGPSSDITVYHTFPGVDVLRDREGNAATVYDNAAGMKTYTERDANNNVTRQGYLFNPLPTKPLSVEPRNADQQLLDRFNGR